VIRFITVLLSSLLCLQGCASTQIESLPDRNARLSKLLPVIQSENPGLEQPVTLQALRDVSEVIDFISTRPDTPWTYEDGGSPLPPNKILGADTRKWPDVINIVHEPGDKGCFDFCRALLLRGDAKHINIIETEDTADVTAKFTRATQYQLDNDSCIFPKDDDIDSGDLTVDETLNLYFNNYDPSATPALGLCFRFKPAEIPSTGMFLYLNTASPFWPKAYERPKPSTKYVDSNDGGTEQTLLAIYKTTYPAAFKDLSTDFYVKNRRHLSLEHKSANGQSRKEALFESACINVDDDIPETVLDMLLESHKSRGVKSPFPPDIQRDYNTICYGTRVGEDSPREDEDKFPPIEYLTYDPFKELSDDDIIQRFKRAHKQLLEAPDQRLIDELRSELYFSEKFKSQAVAQAAFPIYRDLILKHDQYAAVAPLSGLPAQSLTSHIEDLNKIRDHILDKAGCDDSGCKDVFVRAYGSSPTVRIRSRNDWGYAAGLGASIYSAAGPDAVKELEIAHDKGLGGAVYALGCVKGASKSIETYGLAVAKKSGHYPQIKIRHIRSMRHGVLTAQAQKILETDQRIAPYRKFGLSSWKTWGTEEPFCRYREDNYKQ